jgi:hypothetical protein
MYLRLFSQTLENVLRHQSKGLCAIAGNLEHHFNQRLLYSSEVFPAFVWFW